MSNLATSLDELYTYADYLFWDDDGRYEIIDGIAYAMSSPTVRHQEISGELYGTIWEFLKGKPCRVFAAPFDVRLFPKDNGSDDTVVQPDVLVVCDESKLADGEACRGAPDFVVEVVSPSTKMIDKFIKKDLYCKAGVKEYWIIGIDKVFTYVLVDAVNSETIYEINSSHASEIPVSVLSGCIIKI